MIVSTPGKAALLALNVRSRCQRSTCGWRVNRGLMKNKRRGRGQRRGRRSTLITGRGGLRFARADRQERQRTQLASLGSGSGVILLKTRSQPGCSLPPPLPLPIWRRRLCYTADENVTAMDGGSHGDDCAKRRDTGRRGTDKGIHARSVATYHSDTKLCMR